MSILKFDGYGTSANKSDKTFLGLRCKIVVVTKYFDILERLLQVWWICSICFAISDKITFKELSDLLSEKLDERNGIKEMHAAFELFDSDFKGYITIDDLRRVAEELGETIAEDQLKVS